MKLFFVAAFIGFLTPFLSWGQVSPIPSARLAAAKPESKQARYAQLDQYAQHLPESQAINLEKLTASLAAQARTDDDKARLIFSWLAHHVAYDVAYLRGDTTHLYTPEAVLQSRKAICQGYADLFTEMATRMKLEALTVVGHAYDWLTTGNKLDNTNEHAWNVYRIAGNWHWADATWGAGNTGWDTNEFEAKFDDYWFDTPPAQAVFTHLPSQADWQLLPMPITAADFQRWPYIEPAWFKLVGGASLIRAFGSTKIALKNLPTLTIDASKTSCPVQIVQAPIQSTLIAGQPVKFIFSAPSDIQLTVILFDKIVTLQSNGLHQQATIIPDSDRIHVSARHKADSTEVFSLEYDVIPVPRPRKMRPGEHRATPTDSIVYLRR
jgi:hypothetical protein